MRKASFQMNPTVKSSVLAGVSCGSSGGRKKKNSTVPFGPLVWEENLGEAEGTPWKSWFLACCWRKILENSCCDQLIPFFHSRHNQGARESLSTCTR